MATGIREGRRHPPRRALGVAALMCCLCANDSTGFVAVASAQAPELIVQTGHSGTVNSLAQSHDGQWLASGSADRSVRLWHLASGRELRSLRDHPQDVTAVAWSRDDQLLASGGNDGAIRLWETSTGRLISTIAAHEGFVTALAFSPDGQALVSSGTDKSLKLWHPVSAQRLRSVEGLAESVDALAYSPDGRTLATGGVDRNLRLWDTTTWRELRSLRGGKGAVSAVAFSPDGRTVAFGSDDTSGGDASTVHLYDAPSGRALRTLKVGTPYVFAVSFSTDGRTLAVANEGAPVQMADIASGRWLRPLAGHVDAVKSLRFLANGQLASGGFDGQIRLWDSATGQTQRVLAGDTSPADAIALSEDGKLLASANEDRSISLWRLAETQQPQRLFGHGNVATAVAFSPDGATLATGSLDGDIRVWSTEDGRPLAAFKAQRGEDSVALTLAFSRDGRRLASGAFGVDALQLWDVPTGRALRAVGTGGSGETEAFAFSADGGLFGVAGGDGAIQLWDLLRGGPPRRLPPEPSAAGSPRAPPYASITFSADGRTLAAGRAAGVDLWDLGTGRRLRTLARPRSTGAVTTQAHRRNAVWPLAFSRDGRFIAGGAEDGTLALWDAANGQRLRSANGHRGNVTAVQWSADGRLLLSSSDDATLRLWDTASGRELAQLVSTGSNEGLVVAPDGLFDGAPPSWPKILWRFSTALRDVASVEVFFNEYFYPNLLAELLRGERPRAAQDLAKRDRRQPEVRVTLAATDGTAPATAIEPWRASDGAAASRHIGVRLSVADTGGGARDLRLFRNGSLVKAWRGAVLAGQKSVQLEASVTLVAGANRFVAYAFNDDNVKSEDGLLVVQGAASLRRAGTLHLLSVGINRYANPAFDLNFAVADAEALTAELRRQQASLGQFPRIEARLLLDQFATKQGMLGALRELAQTVQPEDSVVLFFAGHGLAEDPRFYLIPHDLGYAGTRDSDAMTARMPDVLAHGVSDEELERALEPLDAAQVLLIIDACNSGQALETAEKRRGPMNSRGLAQLAYEKGMSILTAAQSYQAALETAQFGHGLLTYTLVEQGLKNGHADARPTDGQIIVREWFDYATRQVPLLQFEQMRSARQLGRTLAIVEGEEKIPEIERRSLQRPRVFYRREAPASPLVIGRVGGGAGSR